MIRRVDRLTERAALTVATAAAGGQLHDDAEHVAAVLAALEEAGMLTFPADLPPDEQAADVLRQLGLIHTWSIENES
jgi:hypothetical protein